VSAAGSFLRTSDAGLNWEVISGLPSREGKMSDPFQEKIFVTDTRGIVIRSTNGGNLFHDVQTNNTKPLRNIFFHDTESGHVVGDSGVILFTTNAGDNWTFQNSGTLSNIRGIWFINRDTGFAVGDNGVILKTYNRGVMVGVNNFSEVIPDKFNLHQNFPNPFNPATEIQFDLPEAAFVTLKVYDITGKEVAELLSERRETGHYSIMFNASKLSSGVYYFKLEAGTFSSVKKMIVLK